MNWNSTTILHFDLLAHLRDCLLPVMFHVARGTVAIVDDNNNYNKHNNKHFLCVFLRSNFCAAIHFNVKLQIRLTISPCQLPLPLFIPMTVDLQTIYFFLKKTLASGNSHTPPTTEIISFIYSHLYQMYIYPRNGKTEFHAIEI